MNPIVQMLMSRLQQKNPQGYNAINQAMQNNGNPKDIVEQMFKNATPEQRQSVLNQARSYGCPNDILSKLQNLK